MFCSLWVASEGWWLLLPFGWAVCKLPSAAALFATATDTFFFWEKRVFEICKIDVQALLWGSKLSFTIGKLWEGCGTGLLGTQIWEGTGFASDLCIATWICRSPCTQQRENTVDLGCNCSAKCRFVVILVVFSDFCDNRAVAMWP